MEPKSSWMVAGFVIADPQQGIPVQGILIILNINNIIFVILFDSSLHLQVKKSP